MFQFAEVAADQFLTEDRLFSFENVSLFQEVMGDICAEEVQVSEEEFLNLKCIDELEVNVLKSLVGNGESLFYFIFTFFCTENPFKFVFINVIDTLDDFVLDN